MLPVMSVPVSRYMFLEITSELLDIISKIIWAFFLQMLFLVPSRRSYGDLVFVEIFSGRFSDVIAPCNLLYLI